MLKHLNCIFPDSHIDFKASRHRTQIISLEEGEGIQHLLTPTLSCKHYKAHWQYFK